LGDIFHKLIYLATLVPTLSMPNAGRADRQGYE
jgi:hypothetical protein